MSRLLRPALVAIPLLVLAAACEVRPTLTVEMEEDGSGTVEVAVGLDAEALARVPDLDDDGDRDEDDLTALVRGDDLVEAGWTVEPAETDDGGTTWQRVTHPFGTPEEADVVLAGVTGADGWFPDLRVGRSESFGRTEYSFEGTADLRGGVEALGDESTAALLDGEPLGADAGALGMIAGRPLSEAVDVEVVARLPGDETTWSPVLGEGPTTLSSSSTVTDLRVWGLVALAAVAVLVGVVAAVVGAVRSRAS